MPSSLRFGAFLVYSPAPVDDYGRSVKNFVLGLKQDRQAVKALRDQL